MEAHHTSRAWRQSVPEARSVSHLPHFASYARSPEFAEAVTHARDLYSALPSDTSDEQRCAVERAIDLAFFFHQEPVESDIPYLYHCLAVAQTVRDGLGHSDPLSLTAALLHDTAEDQYGAVLDFFGVTSAGAAALDERRSLAVQLLARCCSSDERSMRDLESALTSLTNPDFSRLIAALGAPRLDPQGAEQATRLLDVAGSIESDVLLHHPYDLRNELYLGHFRRILSEKNVATVVKLADFFRNALVHGSNVGHSESVVEVDRFACSKYAPVSSLLRRWLDTDDAVEILSSHSLERYRFANERFLQWCTLRGEPCVSDTSSRALYDHSYAEFVSRACDIVEGAVQLSEEGVGDSQSSVESLQLIYRELQRLAPGFVVYCSDAGGDATSEKIAARFAYNWRLYLSSSAGVECGVSSCSLTFAYKTLPLLQVSHGLTEGLTIVEYQ